MSSFDTRNRHASSFLRDKKCQCLNFTRCKTNLKTRFTKCYANPVVKGLLVSFAVSAGVATVLGSYCAYMFNPLGPSFQEKSGGMETDVISSSPTPNPNPNPPPLPGTIDNSPDDNSLCPCFNNTKVAEIMTMVSGSIYDYQVDEEKTFCESNPKRMGLYIAKISTQFGNAKLGSGIGATINGDSTTCTVRNPVNKGDGKSIQTISEPQAKACIDIIEDGCTQIKSISQNGRAIDTNDDDDDDDDDLKSSCSCFTNEDLRSPLKANFLLDLGSSCNTDTPDFMQIFYTRSSGNIRNNNVKGTYGFAAVVTETEAECLKGNNIIKVPPDEGQHCLNLMEDFCSQLV